MRAGSKIATVVAATILLSSGGVNAGDAQGTVDELKRCARIADTTARVGCYEALGQRVLAAEVPAAPKQAPKQAPEQAPEQAPVAKRPPVAPVVEAAEAPPAAASLPADLGQPKKEEKKKKEPPAVYRGHVRSCRENMDGIWYFTFDNGQVWYQSSRGHHRFESCDFDVTVTKDFFGYKMAIDGGRTLRVRRQR